MKPHARLIWQIAQDDSSPPWTLDLVICLFLEVAERLGGPFLLSVPALKFHRRKNSQYIPDFFLAECNDEPFGIKRTLLVGEIKNKDKDVDNSEPLLRRDMRYKHAFYGVVINKNKANFYEDNGGESLDLFWEVKSVKDEDYDAIQEFVYSLKDSPVNFYTRRFFLSIVLKWGSSFRLYDQSHKLTEEYTRAQQRPDLTLIQCIPRQKALLVILCKETDRALQRSVYQLQRLMRDSSCDHGIILSHNTARIYKNNGRARLDRVGDDIILDSDGWESIANFTDSLPRLTNEN